VKPFIHYKETFFVKLALAFIGVAIMALGIGFMRYASLGIDPVSCLNTGLARKLGMSFGNWQIIFNLILLVFIIFADRHQIGFGSVFNMVGIGYASDFFLFLFNRVHISSEALLPARFATLIIGTVLLYFGAAMYIEARMGVAPYDALALVIAEKTRRPEWYRWYRITGDALCVLVGFLTGSDVGLGTLITAFFGGILISFFRTFFQSHPETRNGR
jgi:uncharacterized membrane protein YczE